MAAHILDTFYRLERASVLSYLTREVGPEHASDLAQEVFVRAASSTQLHQLRNPGGFLRCIARNLVVDFTRRQRCRIATFPLAKDCDAPSRAEQEDRLHAAEVVRACERALAALPRKTARIFVMSRVERKSHREIHRELGIGLSTVDYHVTKALAHLRAALAIGDSAIPD